MIWQTVIPNVGGNELTFDNFEVGPNRMLFNVVKAIAEGRRSGQVVYLWGHSGAGKTHLLHACCVETGSAGRPFRFLNGDEYVTGQALDELAGYRESGILVCLDDLQPTSQGGMLELGWLSLYETVRQSRGNLVVAASSPPEDMDLKTPDLISRLISSEVFHLQPMNDVGKRRVLMKRSQERGFELPPSVVDYILHNHARDTRSLFHLLDRIDSASLSQQRRVTIPFLRKLLVDQGQSNHP